LFEAGTGYGNVEFVASMAAVPMIDTPEAQRHIAEIVFAILRHLYLNSHFKRQAMGLAEQYLALSACGRREYKGKRPS
jgi:hypothetical protein